MARSKSPITQWVEDNIDPLISHPIAQISHLNTKGHTPWDALNDTAQYSAVYRAMNKLKKKNNPKSAPKQETDVEEDIIQLTEEHRLIANKLATVVDALDDVCDEISNMFEQNLVEGRVFEKTLSSRDSLQEVFNVLKGNQDRITSGAYKQNADYTK